LDALFQVVVEKHRSVCNNRIFELPFEPLS